MKSRAWSSACHDDNEGEKCQHGGSLTSLGLYHLNLNIWSIHMCIRNWVCVSVHRQRVSRFWKRWQSSRSEWQTSYEISGVKGNCFEKKLAVNAFIDIQIMRGPWKNSFLASGLWTPNIFLHSKLTSHAKWMHTRAHFDEPRSLGLC